MTHSLTYDGPFGIATGNGRNSKVWKNQRITWSGFLSKISKTKRTAETFADYLSFEKDKQDEIKDIGGYVGGYLLNGIRKKGTCKHRQLLTLDLDKPDPDFWECFTLLYGNAAIIHSTHKHSPETPRLRLIMPLSRECDPLEYQNIGKHIAASCGIEQADPTTFQPERLMYWPSSSKDGEYLFTYQDGPWLNVDAILRAGIFDESERTRKELGDPTRKPGEIGAFCRAYDVHEAIAEFLPEVYEPCDVPDRYTYKAGSTAGGLVIFEDGQFAHSFHSTDPAGGKSCNSFDLVRLHLFGELDKEKGDIAEIQDTPSHVAMLKLARENGKVKDLVESEQRQQALEDFASIADPAQTPALADFEKYRVTIEADIPGSETFCTINGAAFMANDNISTISGPGKAMKSQIISAVVAGAISKDGNIPGIPALKVEAPQDGKAVVLIDTEQAEADFQHLVRSAAKRIEIHNTPENLLCYAVRALPFKQYKDLTKGILAAAAAAFNGIRLLVIDGIADFIPSVNDEEQAHQITQFATQLASCYHCPVLVVIHQNPGGDKERGHLGSELQRKSYGLVTLSRKADTATISPKMLRKAGHGDMQDVHLIYDKLNGYAVQVDNLEAYRAKSIKEHEELRALAGSIFGSEKGAIGYNELVRRAGEITGKKVTASKDLLKRLINLEILKNTGTGKYIIGEKVGQADLGPDDPM